MAPKKAVRRAPKKKRKDPRRPNLGVGRRAAGAKQGPIKSTAALREILLKALDEAGGVAYLVRCANECPRDFLTLIARLLPKNIDQRITGTGTINVISEFEEFDAFD